jgi:hypothetical protein
MAEGGKWTWGDLRPGDASEEILGARGDVGNAVGRFKTDRGLRLVCIAARTGEVKPFLKEVEAI